MQYTLYNGVLIRVPTCTTLEDNKKLVHLDCNEYITALGRSWPIPYGFMWDRASKPAIGKPFGFDANDPRTMLASLWHDFIYYFHPVTRALADKGYREISIANKYPVIKANIEYGALRTCAGSHWENKEDDKLFMTKYVNTWKTRPDFLDLLRIYPKAVQFV